MRHIIAKEFASFLNSLIAYLVMAVFLTTMGLLLWVFPDTSVLEYGFADMGTLFSLAPYVFIFLIPAITMRSLSEERKTGTMELLLTKPLSEWDIVLGKFVACFLLAAVTLLPTLVYYFTLRQLGNPVGNIDTSGVLGSYIGLLFLSAVFCATGLLASSVTANQVVAFMIAAFLCFIFFTGFDSLAALPALSSVALVVKQAGILYHYESLSKGLIDSRDVVYFTTTTFFLLFITKTILSSRSW
jgi:ABC-2 type transport system permease protein